MNDPGALKLLIVEDNESVRHLIKSVVAGLAGKIYECSDGADALAAYNCHHPDFVLMDIKMGTTDGITATRWIKAADPAARIIIVTDYDQLDLREAVREAGACPTWRRKTCLNLCASCSSGEAIRMRRRRSDRFAALPTDRGVDFSGIGGSASAGRPLSVHYRPATLAQVGHAVGFRARVAPASALDALFSTNCRPEGRRYIAL
jgi:CheY-like chemotaxis protein